METFNHLFDFARATPDISGLVNLAFYQEINNFLRDELSEFQTNLVGRMMTFLGVIALAVLTIWIFYQGFRILTGRSRESMMGLVVDSLRATLIIGFATGFAAGNATIYNGITDGLGDVIVGVVADGDANSLYGDMDKALATMSLALGSVEAVKVEPGSDAETSKKRSMYFVGIGTAGPAITAGIMLTLNKVAMALFVGLGPLFILCLLFDATKSLFQRWLLYGIGTLFSLAVLYVMVMLAMDLTLAVAAAFWANNLLSMISEQGINTMAIQQGGLGLILTMLLISAPPMAATFFQGTLGSFMHYNALSPPANNSPGPQGQPPGAYAPPPTNQQKPEVQPQAQAPTPNVNPGRVTHQQEQPREEGLKSADQARTPGNR
jgi:type IV secretion system protein VirB6